MPARSGPSAPSGGKSASSNLVDIRVRVSRKAVRLTVAIILIIAVGSVAVLKLKSHPPNRPSAAPPPTDESLSAANKPINVPPSESTEVITFADPVGLSPRWVSFRSYFEVQIHRILKGKRVFEEQKLYSFQVEDPKKEPVYFEVSVKNVGWDEKSVYGWDFRLIDESGYSYSDIQTRDYINGDISIGTTVRGGISFAIYRGAKPKTLIFDTGLVRSLGIEAELPVMGAYDEYLRNAAVGAGTKITAEANLKHNILFQPDPTNP